MLKQIAVKYEDEKDLQSVTELLKPMLDECNKLHKKETPNHYKHAYFIFKNSKISGKNGENP